MRSYRAALLPLLCVLVIMPGSLLSASLTFDSPADLSGWTTDRFDPAFFQINGLAFPGNSVLEVAVKGSDLQADSFYNYQGKQHALPPGTTSFSASVYYDPVGTTDVNDGIWGVGKDMNGNISAYPIVAIRRSSTGAFATGLYVFDYNDVDPSEDWIQFGSVDSGWNDIQATLGVGGVDFRFNGNYVGTYADPLTKSFDTLIVNVRNFGQDHAFYIDNIAPAVTSAVPTPTAATMGIAMFGPLTLRRRRTA